ncbi:MAG: biopolymer transporter ExbD [Elusimicrobiota bacterium]|jgi:biopolymer transport protein ExbD
MGAAPGQRDDEPITSINITPLVDVSLVLVIIFMAIAPFALSAGIKVLESRASAAVGKVSAAENVSLRLFKDGKVTLNGQTVDPLLLGARLAQALAASRDKMVLLSADDENKVGEVVEVLDLAKQSGAEKLAIMREAKPGEKPADGAKG